MLNFVKFSFVCHSTNLDLFFKIRAVRNYSESSLAVIHAKPESTKGPGVTYSSFSEVSLAESGLGGLARLHIYHLI